ncbi:MAG: hypothetical protein KME43_13180 [Myxacorys chilensis ATA2-1-KO14]|jgi:uncharacterized cupredoxin-like copper-binding protein|nr:hypothetical protein [Myxacorys chilensis ATA2-1-KO14]
MNRTLTTGCTKLLRIAASVILLSSIAACGNKQANAPSSQPNAAAPQASTAPQNAAATTVEVVETEMAIKLSKTTVPQGPVQFVVKNQGKVPHEMVLLKTDLPLDQLPTKNDGKFDEQAKSVKEIIEIEEDELKSGGSKSVSVPLSKGRYVVVCNVGKHFEKGMKTALTVQ